jgi:adenylate cyclase class IV
MNKTYEVEVKSLLGSKDNVQILKNKLDEFGYKKVGQQAHLNHYFNYSPDDADALIAASKTFLSPESYDQFADQLSDAKEVSIRTRQSDGVVYFVAKLSVGDDSSANGVLRHEIQEQVDMTLDELDQQLLSAGLEYQAKWSRDREEYRSDDQDFYITVDRNAGYGYLCEVELEVNDPNLLDDAKSRILDLMNSLDIEELSQDRLGRMFDHYNQNWPQYYGTENIFTIE